jgi:hypothetical protein
MITNHKHDVEGDICTFYSTREDGSIVAYWACHCDPYTWEYRFPDGHRVINVHEFDTFDECMSHLLNTLKEME